VTELFLTLHRATDTVPTLRVQYPVPLMPMLLILTWMVFEAHSKLGNGIVLIYTCGVSYTHLSYILRARILSL